jgi:hypothetical protein
MSWTLEDAYNNNGFGQALKSVVAKEQRRELAI